MTARHDSFRAAYRDALHEHLRRSGAQEVEGLSAAEDLSRRALGEGVGVLELVEVHQRAIEDLTTPGPSPATGERALAFLLQSLASLDAATKGFVENRSRLHTERIHTERLESLVKASIAVLAELRLKGRARAAVKQAVLLFEAGGASLQADRESEPVTIGPIPESAAAFGTSLTHDTDSRTRSWATDAEPGQWLGSPLCYGERTSGWIAVWRNDPPFTPFEEALMEEFANILAVALEASRAYEEEWEVAAALQRSLQLPKPQPNPRFVFAARYLPAVRRRGIGGDWFDVIALPNNRIGMAVGDVMGHGVSAAALMGQARMALRAYAVEDRPPAETLSRVDRLFESLEEERIVTMVYAVLDPSGLVRLANAGHPPPLLAGPDGSTAFFGEGRSLPLGIGIDGPPRRDAVLELAPGSVLLLYTDGLVERRGHTIDERLAMFESAVREPAETIDEVCNSSVRNLVDREHEDDICLLAVSLAPFLPRLPDPLVGSPVTGETTEPIG